MKPVLMIHEIEEWMFSLPLENYILTFDDGLYSQYFYKDHFKKLNTQKIYFISSNIICSGIQSTDFPKCHDAHEKAFQGNYEDYMTVDQIKELMSDPLVSIGAHSHNHVRLNQFSTLFKVTNHIKQDTEQMIVWFEDTLNFRPTKFCFPYNESFQGMYPAILKQYGFREFYGNERTPIETLQHN